MAPKVFVTKVQRDALREPKSFVGTIKPLRKSIVGSAAPGRVEEYLVNEGDYVVKGTPIAHLRRGIIAAEKKAAAAELESRKAELAQWDQSFDDEVIQARARLTTAQALLAFRTAKMERSRSLGDSITRELLQEDEALAAQARGTVDEAQASLRLLVNGPRQSKTEQARAKLAVQEAEVERLSEQFDRHTMFAPFNGYVTAEHTEVGQWVMQGDPIAEFVELDVVDVEIAVLEDHVSNLDTNTEGDVEIPALKGRRFSGRVSIIIPQADQRARTFPVKVRVQNEIKDKTPALKSGMFARVHLPVGELLDVEMIPKDALVLSGRSLSVFVASQVDGKTTVRPVPVSVGVSRGPWISVSKGELKEGDLVVVEGNERLRPMQEVRIEEKSIPFPRSNKD